MSRNKKKTKAKAPNLADSAAFFESDAGWPEKTLPIKNAEAAGRKITKLKFKAKTGEKKIKICLYKIAAKTMNESERIS